ncbi:MAG: DrmE family protein [candidate division Zixibacteria bacterium]|nr:DrmE family protein [candidate division Zixibacteria bacterium]MBU1469862.1 DrmE family protein [candidate division Zixibacteria bacterium]MBU2626612.1 DrmE family protein [candidate division Zixibacteria bacterium]
MGYQLTYADRELLLQTFDALKAEWTGKDEELLAAACDWAKGLVPSCGFEHSLVRDVTVLSRYLVARSADEDVADIARGGLLYVLLANQRRASKLGELGLLDEAFMSSYAVHEIRTRLDEQSTYNPPRLTQDEQRHAENLFLEFAEQHVLSDDDLIEQSRIACNGLANLAACGLFQRLTRNIDFLISVVSRSDRSPDHLCFARAALSYLICDEDAIDDRLGIIGYLDDNYVAQMAVDLIEPARDPWLDMLDATVGILPFMNSLVIDDGSGSRPISEYMIINSALSCEELRKSQCSSTVLIVPVAGPTPLLLGFIATLGLIQRSGQRDVTEDTFSVGQKVLVDNCAVAEFAGVKDVAGSRRFGLTQYRRHLGHISKSTHFWPISYLRRLIPAGCSKSTRGELIYDLNKSNAVLPAMEYLFNSSKTAHLASVSRKVLVVTPVASAHDLVRRLILYGHALKEVVPTGHLTDNTLKSWSTRFGDQEPLLLLVSDLDAACVFAEENRDSIDLVVIDAEGRNSKKTASMREMQHLVPRVLIVTSEKNAGELSIANDGSSAVWEWNTDDFSALLWPKVTSSGHDGTIARYESRLQILSSTVPVVECLSCPEADEALESIRILQSVARQRGEESIAELNEIVALAFGVGFRLLRSATLLKSDITSISDIEQNLTKLSTLPHVSPFLSETERKTVSECHRLLKRFLDVLKCKNPKATALQELLYSRPQLMVICPDVRNHADLRQAYAGTGTRVMLDHDDTDDSAKRGALVPGWFGKDRMAALLIPPVAEPIILVLYDIERRWYEFFRNERHKHRLDRARVTSRSDVFPGFRGWTKQLLPQFDTAGTPADTGTDGLEAIQQYVRATYRERAYSAAKSDGTETEVRAFLVFFEGDAYAFLRESFKANVVTHLLDAVIEDDENSDLDINRKTVRDLQVGDAVLFHRRSNCDVVRLAADEELHDNERETATLWRNALVDYAQHQHIDSEEVWRLLQKAGCPLHYQTIRGWMEDDEMIAPRRYDRDVRIIAKLTGDRQLNERLEAVLAAIHVVFGAHQRASRRLARQVLRRAVTILREDGCQSKLIEIESDVVLVRVLEIDDSSTQVRISIANHLQEFDQWHV